MINEGGKWAHVVLRKCVFEPKAAGISRLMHQPSTGHLSSTGCWAVSSVPEEQLPLSHFLPVSLSPSFSLSLFLIFDLSCPLLPFVHLFHTSFVSFNYRHSPALLSLSLFTLLLLLGSSVCLAPLSSLLSPLSSLLSPLSSLLSPLSSPPFSTTLTGSLGLHTPHNSISVFGVCVI